MDKTNNYFHPSKTPTIYAYSDTAYPNQLKIGYTTRSVTERMAEHYPTKTPTQTWQIVLSQPAIKNNGEPFSDRDIHTYLQNRGIQNTGGEWYACTVHDVKNAILATRDNIAYTPDRTQNFRMRPEQADAVNMTEQYFKKITADGQTPKFLWNAKMRFGKTFTAYQFAKRMGYKKILILTFKPAVQHAWRDDLLTHTDFENWQFCDRDILKNAYNNNGENIDFTHPTVYFASLQDILGTDTNTRGLKPKNQWVHTTHWDLVIFDEYHFGAWRDNTQELFEDTEETLTAAEKRHANEMVKITDALQDNNTIPITTDGYLYLSGTPFRAINTGEFIEDCIFNWTYTDEQRAKANWQHDTPNPYAPLPRMVMMSYKIPDAISHIAKQGEYNEFDLNAFFKAEYKNNITTATFTQQKYVQKWLNFIRGANMQSFISDLKHDKNRAILPFDCPHIYQHMNHTIWYLPNVSSCYAMYNLLQQQQNAFFNKDYKIIICAGANVGNGADALPPVLQSIANNPKTITLTCGKLMTGVTVPPWSAIFMLRSLKSAESYFQSAFRVQNPHTAPNENDPNKTDILKHNCYILDFAPNRALRLLSEYSTTLAPDNNNTNVESALRDFTAYLPILSYDGGVMQEIDERGILDIAVVGTSASLLAKRWEASILVNVDNNTLEKVLNNEIAMQAIESIEGFRNLKGDMQAIISRSQQIKDLKDKKQTSNEDKQQLNQAEKDRKTKREEIKNKLLQFATRIPVFMYLSDYREYNLEDVIRKLEPDLFTKVTGLQLKDFELLVNLGLFSRSHMDNAVYAFKRYEESSLSYTGIPSMSNKGDGTYTRNVVGSDSP